jgi:hypothetical protein
VPKISNAPSSWRPWWKVGGVCGLWGWLKRVDRGFSGGPALSPRASLWQSSAAVWANHSKWPTNRSVDPSICLSIVGCPLRIREWSWRGSVASSSIFIGWNR